MEPREYIRGPQRSFHFPRSFFAPARLKSTVIVTEGPTSRKKDINAFEEVWQQICPSPKVVDVCNRGTITCSEEVADSTNKYHMSPRDDGLSSTPEAKPVLQNAKYASDWTGHPKHEHIEAHQSTDEELPCLPNTDTQDSPSQPEVRPTEDKPKASQLIKESFRNVDIPGDIQEPTTLEYQEMVPLSIKEDIFFQDCAECLDEFSSLIDSSDDSECTNLTDLENVVISTHNMLIDRGYLQKTSETLGSTEENVIEFEALSELTATLDPNSESSSGSSESDHLLKRDLSGCSYDELTRHLQVIDRDIARIESEIQD